MADRAINPTKTDISRLYQEWRSKELGAENGKALFDKLDAEIALYNDAHFSQGGQAKLQVFQCEASSTDSDSEAELTVPVSRTRKRSQPMIIAICTQLMSRVHQNIQQSCEMVFCDATSSLDRFNSSLFILSNSTYVGALPFGVIMTDEEQDTIRDGLKLLNDDHSFYGHGKPAIVMTDDSSAECNALRMMWPDANLLLCSFHFLQRNWTWLHDGSNAYKMMTENL